MYKTTSALRGISVTRPFFKLYDGIKDLVKQPYLSYKENKGMNAENIWEVRCVNFIEEFLGH